MAHLVKRCICHRLCLSIHLSHDLFVYFWLRIPPGDVLKVYLHIVFHRYFLAAVSQSSFRVVVFIANDRRRARGNNNDFLLEKSWVVRALYCNVLERTVHACRKKGHVTATPFTGKGLFITYGIVCVCGWRVFRLQDPVSSRRPFECSNNNTILLPGDGVLNKWNFLFLWARLGSTRIPNILFTVNETAEQIRSTHW